MSLDEVDKETKEPEIEVTGSLNTKENAIFNETLKRFIACLDSVEKEIVYMRIPGAKQDEIAQALQYKSHPTGLQASYRVIYYLKL